MEAGIAVAVIILISVINGYRKGFLRTLFSLGCVILSIVLSFMVNPVITDFLTEKVHLDSYISEGIEKYLQKELDEKIENIEAAEKERQIEFIEDLEIPGSWKKTLVEEWQNADLQTSVQKGFVKAIADSLAFMGVKQAAFILTFITIIIFINAVSVILGIINHIPIINEVNRFLGAGFGLAQGLLLIWFFMLLIFFTQNYSWGNQLVEWILENSFTAFLYEHNFLAWLLSFIF